MGFQTSIVSVDNLEKVLDICTKNKIHVILHIRPNLSSSGGHCVLYLKRDDKQIYVNDPEKKNGETAMKLTTLKKLLTPTVFSSVVERNTLILVNTYKKKLPVSKILCNEAKNKTEATECFECIKEYVKKALCPVHDHFFNVKKN